MEFVAKIMELSTRIPQQLEHIHTEEATKNALIMPFINALGYNVFNPQEVIPEFTADVGTKKGEKVDYAIAHEGKIAILFECKSADTELQNQHASQLFRYYTVTEAKIGILTNGVEYRFFTELDAPNMMDSKPFLVIDMLNPEESLLQELQKLSKDDYSLDDLLSTASELKYSREIKRILNNQLKEPTEDFVRFFGSQLDVGRMTQNTLSQLMPIVRKSLNQFITEKVNERLTQALGSNVVDDAPASASPEIAEEQEPEVSDDGIQTTEEELEGFQIVRSILREKIDPGRITYRDTKSYFGVLLDDNNRKPICRLHFNSATTKYVTVFDENKELSRVDIEKVDDLFKLADHFEKAVSAYETI